MKNGIYALASLDGRPLDPRDLAVMGLIDDNAGIQAAPGCLLRPQDVRASAIYRRSEGDGITTLLGDLDEPEDAARAMGLAPTTDPLTIVLTTVERFGDRAPSRLVGTWLLARWNARSAIMTLLMAERVRDTCYVVTDGRLVALSPEIVRLARLDWVDAKLDPTNLLLRVGRAQLRQAAGNRTFLRDVTRVMPGTRVIVRAGGITTSVAEPLPVPSVASSVRFEEAVDQLDVLLRRIVRQQLEREGDAALSLSGGLDSSLLALYAAQEGGDRRLTFLTSAAPSGSGIADESGLAAIVAAHLGVPIEKVAPPITTDIYRPSEQLFAAFEHPLVSARHYLDEALEKAALDHGAAALINGIGGEMTVTNSGVDASWTGQLRAIARGGRNRWRNRPGTMTAVDCLHIRPSSAALDRLSVNLVDLWQTYSDPRRQSGRRAPLGIDPGWNMMTDLPSCSETATLRHISPFFDGRLIRQAAALPALFARHNKWDRALGRRLAHGSLPNGIALQRKGLAYSPGYYLMLQEQALMARARLRDLAANDIGEWLDLTWIDRGLIEASQIKIDLRTAFQLQLSMAFAEFVAWWGDRVKPTSPV